MRATWAGVSTGKRWSSMGEGAISGSAMACEHTRSRHPASCGSVAPDHPMKFLCLIYNDPKDLEALPEGKFDTLMKECIAYDEELKEKGVFVQAEFLQPATAAVTLRTRGGKLSRTDGPFAETKELLGGFQII